MKTIEVTGTKREALGKSAMKKIRRGNKVPGIVYGHGEPVAVSVDHLPIHRAIHSPETYIVNLNIDGSATNAVIREAQFHPVTDNILHVDFLRVSDAHEIEVELPLKLVGTSKGVLAGGKLVPLLRRIKVKGLPSQLPDHVDVDITELELGKTIRVADVTAEGFVVTSPTSAGIAVIEIPRAVRTAAQ